MKNTNLINLKKLDFPIPRIVCLEDVKKGSTYTRYAVRSLGSLEDSINVPSSGIFKSILNVKSDEIEEAIDEVINSFTSKRALAYMKIKKVKIEAGYFIQEMVKAKTSAIVKIKDKTIKIYAHDGDCENITNGQNTYTIDEKTNKDINFTSLMNILNRFKQDSNIELEMIMDDSNKWWIVQMKYKKPEDTDIKNDSLNLYDSNISMDEIAKECPAIFNYDQKPFVIPLSEFKEGIEVFIKKSCMIDLDNEIAFIGISHKSLIERIFDFGNVTVTPKSGFQAMNKMFHETYNMIEISSSKNNNYFTSGYEKTIIDFTKSIPDFDFSYIDNLTLLEDKNTFINIHSKDDIKKLSGKIYYPEKNEEDIPDGSFIIIPEASEDYMLPSFCLSEYKGCVITEKGSQAAHLASLSSDIGFNMILIPDASKRFIAGDILELDFEKNTFY